MLKPTRHRLLLIATLAGVGAGFTPTAAHAEGLWNKLTAPARERASQAAKAAGTPLVFVLSDTHASEGVRPTGKMSPLEDFVVDDDFHDFVGHALTRQRTEKAKRAKIVLAGDVFDFLKVVTPPTGEHWPTAGKMADADERNVAPDGPVAAMKMRRILEAHPKFIASMRTWIEAGNDLVILAGNHDQELFHSQVRRELRKALGPTARARMTFAPRDHFDGDMVIEHGQRYDPMNSVSSMLSPFDGEGGDRRLRPSAGNFMVVKMHNRLKERAPRVNQVNRGSDMIKVAARRAPKQALGIFGFFATMSQRTGKRAPTHASEETQGHHKDLAVRKAWVNEVGLQINATRKSRGQKPLVGEDLVSAVRAWDDFAVKPYLETLDVQHGRVRGMIQMLKPSEVKKWVDAELGNTQRRAENFALDELVNVHVSGHTHGAAIEEVAPHGQKRRHIVRRALGLKVPAQPARYVANAGTWTPVADGAGAVDPRAKLTYLEVSRASGRTQPRLMRWDATQKTGVVHAEPTRRRAPSRGR